ncbi:MAG: ABC-type dipeptide/oligopeptide/nickel transport system, permease component [Ilumatobacteraceae bacterium]|nr:ABC-type dipeptide/oligopeptide/nickel transport system, permease component [Ilumatobacteraceae bacterium]
MSDLILTPNPVPPPDVNASLADVGPSRSLASDAWRRFKRNKLAMFGLVLVVFLAVVSLAGPFLVQDPLDTSGLAKQSPGNGHLMGTDSLGRDVMSRIVYGIRLSLFIGIVVTLIETFIGILVGAVAGWRRGWVDSVLMRFVDVLLGIPYLVLALAMVTIIGKGVAAVILTLAVTAWLQTARNVRAGFLQARETEYVEAAKAVGVSSKRIMARHILPNVFQPVVVLAAVGVGSAILAEAALSFLGVGVKKPAPSLGLMISESQSSFSSAPHLLIFPGLAIAMTVLGFLLVGDGLRDALDVKDT